MDCRAIKSLQLTFDGIIGGFFLPYLSESECNNFIEDCTRLLNNNGTLYLSFVEGDDADSGYKTGTTGDRTYFYFHNTQKIITHLQKNNFGDIKVLKKLYKRNNLSTEEHTIIISKVLINNT